jgi:hypothetical protein
MGIKSDYYVDEIAYKTAMYLLIEHHYLHRKASCSYAFGLIHKETKEIVGVITYGLPASPNVCRGICGKEEEKNVYELTRLWVKDEVPKNAESFLIGNTIKLLNKEIIVSYSEPEMGHVGTVYQATNFLYCGLTAKRTNRVKVNGENKKHNRHAAYDKEDTILVPRPQKHRYIFFNCNKKRKRELIKQLKYDIKPYPKKIDNLY